MSYRFTSVITKEGRWYVARCAELGVVSQGKTIEAAQKNLQEAVALYLEGRPIERRRSIKFAPLVTTFELHHA